MVTLGSPPFNYDTWKAQQEAEDAEAVAAMQPAQPEPEDPWASLLDEAEDGLADEVEDEEEPAAEEPEQPRIETEEDKAEAEAAVRRLRYFDPADSGELQHTLENGSSDEQKAEAALRLAEIAERGEFAAQWTPALIEEISTSDQEMRLLEDDLKREPSLRKRKELEDQYQNLSLRVPRIKRELKARKADANFERAIQAEALAQAKAEIMDARREKMRQAEGLSPIKREEARWEMEQPIPEAELNKLARQTAAGLRLEHRQNVANRYIELTAAEDAKWRTVVEFHFPSGSDN